MKRESVREERLLIQCDFFETGISAHLLLKYMRTRRIDFELSEHYFQYHIRLGHPVLETLRRNLKLSLECLYLDIWTQNQANVWQTELYCQELITGQNLET